MPANFERGQRIPSLKFVPSLNTELTSLVVSPAHLLSVSLAILVAFLTFSTERRLKYTVYSWQPLPFGIKCIMSHHTAIFEIVNFIFLPSSTLWFGWYVIIQTSHGSDLK